MYSTHAKSIVYRYVLRNGCRGQIENATLRANTYDRQASHVSDSFYDLFLPEDPKKKPDKEEEQKVGSSTLWSTAYLTMVW